MKLYLSAIIILFSSSVFADIARIHSITPTFIKFEDGRVGFLDELDNEVLNQLRPGNVLKIKLDSDNTLQEVAISARNESQDSPFPTLTPEEYNPSVLPNYTYATNLLHTFRSPAINGAQCYDKAHVWTYEAEYYYRARLQKAWLFFSDHYIERYRFKWWFHVAPFAKVMMRGSVEERIMDRVFYQYPLKLKLWTDLFMENKVACKEVSSYNDYSQHPGEDDCYVIRSTPYYWQPKDLEALAERGREKNQYINSEISHAYRFGYGISLNQ